MITPSILGCGATPTIPCKSDLPRLPRILICSEASYLSTGFSTYALEVLKRLHRTGKYLLFEYATYGDTSSGEDERWADVPWTFIPVKPNRHDQAQVDLYHKDPTHQFGSWKFEQTLCEVRPDIVWTYRDWWMDVHVENSPFRPYYHWAHMPTVDATPIDEWWLATYMNADSVFGYSDWCLQALKEEGKGKIRTVRAAPPGADFATIFPVADRQAHRKSMGLPEDSLIVGTVMRNQPRKLYPALIRSFARYLASAPAHLARRTYLYLHLRYPDLGWDIPRLIKQYGIGHRTLFTYFCSGCGICFPSFYADATAYCRACGQLKARLPGSDHGVPRTVLNNVYNFFDLYVQYSNSESFGLPMAEAAAAGVPVMGVDYSAMADVVRKLQGCLIRVKAFHKDHDVGVNRAIPDDDDFVQKMISFFSLPEGVRRTHGRRALEACREHYDYDRTAKVWEEHFDNLVLLDRGATWDSGPRLHKPAQPLRGEVTNSEWVRWSMAHIAGRPDLINSHLALRMIRDLDWGGVVSTTTRASVNELSLLGVKCGPRNYNRQNALDELMAMVEKRNHWERQRCGL